MIRAGGCQYELRPSQLNLRRDERPESWEQGLQPRQEEICHFWREGGLGQSDLLYLMPIKIFWMLDVIACVDAYNVRTGSNFLQELCFLLWEGTARGQVHWVSNTCYYTSLWPENRYYLFLCPYSACIPWVTQPCAVWDWRLFILFCSSVEQDFLCAWSCGSKQSLPHLSSAQMALVSHVQ